VLEALQKSRQLSVMALDRLTDYLGLLHIEMKLLSRELGVQLISYLAVALFVLFALLFIGIALIVSLWDSEYRGVAAWVVVALYMSLAGGALAIARRAVTRTGVLATLREELRRDADLIRESL
jgi:uncharacterized membrane protein YqjE